jgi:hypothetical protein
LRDLNGNFLPCNFSALEILMVRPPRLTDVRCPPPRRTTPRRQRRPGAVPAQPQSPVALPVRRFDRVALGFWLGAIVLGTVGCVLGARLTSRYPVAVAVRVLWWGIYLGCLGASVGALIGLLMKRSARPAPPADCLDNPRVAIDLDEGHAAQ